MPPKSCGFLLQCTNNGMYYFFQPQTNGLCQQSEETFHQAVLHMVSCAMEHEFSCLVVWLNMANTPMNSMSYKLADGNGKDLNRNLRKMDLRPVQDWVWHCYFRKTLSLNSNLLHWHCNLLHWHCSRRCTI